MDIKVLGTRGQIKPSAPYHSRKSGVLIDNKILLDCGEAEFLEHKPSHILITHLHPDHAFFINEMPWQTDIPIYAPEKFEDVNITVTNKTFTIDGYRITPIPTIHSIKVQSNAYLIEHDGKKILYTGDMIWIEKKYQEKLPQLDLVITEASFIDTGGMVRRNKETGQIYGHTGVPDLIKTFKKVTNTILFVHFGSWFYKDMEKSRKKFEELAQENDMKLIVGYDGFEMSL